MFKTFAPLEEPAQLRSRIHEIRHKEGESLRVFANMLYGKLVQAFPTLDAQAAEHLTIAYFIKAIQPEIGSKVENRVPETLEKAIQMSLVYEKELLSRKKVATSSRNTSRNRDTLQFLEEDTTKSSRDEVTDENLKVETVPKRHGGQQQVTLCTLMEQMKNGNKQTFQQISELRKQITEIKPKSVTEASSPCTSGSGQTNDTNAIPPLMQPSNGPFSNRRGYNSRYSRTQPYERRYPENSGQRGQTTTKRCFNCQTVGHIARYCPRNSDTRPTNDQKNLNSQ